MTDQGLPNPLRQAASDIASQDYEVPEFESPASRGLRGGERPSSGSGGQTDLSGNLLPPDDLTPMFMETAEEYGVPVNVLMAIAQQESGYQSDAIGPDTQWGRAKGMFQYIDPTARSMGIDPLDTRQAMSATAEQLRRRLDEGATIEEAVMAHHGGTNRRQWGPKTQRYGRSVIEKAGRIYELAGPAAKPQQPENPRAFGESGIPYAPEGQQQKPVEEPQGPQVDGMTGAARPATGEEAVADNRDANVLTDIGNLLQIGVDRAGLNLREGVRQVFGDGVVNAIDRADEWLNNESSEELLSGRIDENTRELTPETFAARRKEWITEDEEGGYSFGPAWSDPRTYMAGLVESLPETAMTMVPGGVLAKGMYARGIAQGLSRAQAGKRAATVATIAGGLTEGFMGGGASAREVKDAIEGMSEEQLANSDAMQVLQMEGRTFEEARDLLAEEASGKAFVLSGVLTGAFGGWGDRALAGILTEGASNRITAAVRGAVAEGVFEEAPQEAGQQASENYAMQEADPSIRIRDNVANAAAGGAVLGGVMGGGIGAAAGGRTDPGKEAGRALGRQVDAARSTGTEAEALAALEPTGRQTETGPDSNPDPDVYENADYSREQWEQDWAEFDRQNPEATIGGAVGDTGKPAPNGPVEEAMQEVEREERVATTEGARVVVRQRTGDIAGTMQSYREDGAGNFEARILGDDGVPYVVNQNDEAKIVREEAAQAAPQGQTEASVPTMMTNDMRRRLKQMGYADAEIRQLRPQEAWDILNQQPAGDPVDAGGDAAADVAGDAPEAVDRPATPRQPDNVAELTDEQLSEQRAYVANQARSSGWTPALNRRRKEIKAEIERRQAEAPAEPVVDNAEDTSPVVDNETADVSDNAEPIVEHTTKRGRTLRGVVRNVSEEEAKGIDPYAFRKDGGWFIRQKRLDEQQSSEPQAEAPAASPAAADDESLVLTSRGQPFKSYEQAMRKIRNRGLNGKPEQLDGGGWGVRVSQEPSSEQIEDAGRATDTTPSEAQIEAENYRKGRVRLKGFDIAIENPKGSTRRGTDADGNAWESTMAHHYGDIKGTTAADGDNLDVFIGDNPEADPVYVVDQINDDGSFDEHKVMVGFDSEQAARDGYLANYEDGWQGLGDISELSTEAFQAWAKAGDLSQPLSSNAVKSKPKSKAKPKAEARPAGRLPDDLRDAERFVVERTQEYIDEMRSVGMEEQADEMQARYDDLSGRRWPKNRGDRLLEAFEALEGDLPALPGNRRMGDPRLDQYRGGGQAQQSEPASEAETSPALRDIPGMSGVMLKRNGEPFASEGAVRQAANNRKQKGIHAVRVPGGYGGLPSEQFQAERELGESLNERLVMAAEAADDSGAVLIRDYERRENDVLGSLANDSYSATGFVQYTFEDADAAERALAMLRERGDIVDDWRGAPMSDGYMDRRVPSAAETVESGNGATVAPGQVLDGNTYIESATVDYVATRRVSDGRLETLSLTPKTAFERAKGVTVSQGESPAPVASPTESSQGGDQQAGARMIEAFNDLPNMPSIDLVIDIARMAGDPSSNAILDAIQDHPDVRNTDTLVFPNAAAPRGRLGSWRLMDRVAPGDRGGANWMKLYPEKLGSAEEGGNIGARAIAEIITHELVHAATTRALHSQRSDHAKQLSDELEAIRARVAEWKDEDAARFEALDRRARVMLNHLIDNVMEVPTVGLTSPEAQAVLKTIPAVRGEMTLWNQLIESLRSFFGLDQQQDASLLGDIVETTARLFAERDSTLDTNDDGSVGRNASGSQLFEDENGARFYYEPGAGRVEEPVEVTPGRGGRVMAERRAGTDFETVEEAEQRRPQQAESSQDGEAVTLEVPMRLYHGTSAGTDFDTFDAGRADSGVGSNARDQGNRFYATTSERAARWFGNRAETARQLNAATGPGQIDQDAAGEVLAFDLPAGSRVLDVENMPRGRDSDASAILSRAEQDGFDAVRFPDRGFDTVEGDPEVGAMFEEEGRPETVIVLNSDAVSRVREPAASANTIFTEDAAEKARQVLRAKLGQLNSGIDPEIMQAGITLAGYHIEKGARSFAAYAKAMTDDLGETVKPYLKSWYMGVKYDPRAAGFDGMDDAATVEAADVDQISSEETPDAGQSDARGGGEDQARGDADSAQRAGGRSAQRDAAPADRGDVEAGPSGDVEAPATAGDRQGDGGGRAEPDVAGAGSSGGRGNAAQRRQGNRGARASDADAGSGRGAGERERVTEPREPDAVSPADPGPGNFHYDNPRDVVGGGQVARFKKNQAAIETYLALRDAGRPATREEQETLAAYTGWGSFGQELFQGTWARPQPKQGWEARDQWLRDHLGKDEWEGMQRSIINAHYTDPPTVMAMWSMLERMGFKGGRVREPSMGIGNFFGMMPAELASRSRLDGIELDPVTGGMAQRLYPEANVRVMGYQEAKTPDDFYDVVIGNWPFENSPIADRRYNRLNPMVHDYFFLKALDEVRPGGIVAAITSAGSMDKKDSRIRREMAKKAELVAAYRLPSGAFQEYAGTKVVTDLLVLRKRPEKAASVRDEDWIDAVDMKAPSGETITVNEYFQRRPENVLGTLDFGNGTTSGRPGMIVHRPRDMQAALDRMVESVPEDAYRESTRADHINYVTNHTDDREGALTRTDDGFYVVRGEQLAPAEEVQKYRVKNAKTTAAREDQLGRLVDMRRQYAALIEAERDVDSDPEPARRALKQAYDGYAAEHGPINDSFGAKYLDRLDDPFVDSLRALEREEGDRWVPATILERSTIRTPQRIDSPSIEEAYVLSRNGAVNPSLDEIAARAGSQPEAAKSTLIDSGAIYETPTGDIVPSDIYLSGNVRQKLREAEASLAEGNRAMQRNVDALREALPADVPYFNIEVQMGASWVPTDIYEQFVAHMLDVDSTTGIKVRYMQGRWKARIDRRLRGRQEASTGFGTKAYDFGKLVNAAISNQTVTIKKKVSNGEGGTMEVLDQEATSETNNKIAEMREQFGEWLWADPDRRHALETEYNEVRNSYATPRYDGSFMRMDGMALTLGNSPFDLRSHQQNAIWRALVTRRSLNAHEVGTGKSFTIAGIAVESRRYGIAKKPLVMAHNANSASLAADINKMYPAAKVLYIDNLSPATIDRKLRQIANDDWDAVVMPHSLIDRLAFTEDTLMAMAREDIDALEAEAREAAQEDGSQLSDKMLDDEAELKKLRSPTAKELVKQRNRIIESIKKQAQKASRDSAVTFEELGIDMVLVDEVHEFKKPPITTKMRIKGLQTQTSQRSLQLRFMTDYVRGQNNGGNVHTFTGTPITNTLTEIFHQMRYVMREDMEAAGVDQWDGFFGSFAKEVQDVELDAAGEWETVNRLRGFINVPELRKLVGQYMDVVFADDMPEMQPRQTDSGKTLTDESLTDAEREQLMNGRTEGATGRPYKKVITDTVDLTDEQQAIFRYAQELRGRWNRMSGKERKEAMANGDPEVPIQIESLVSRASFDARMARDEELAGQEGQVPDDPSSKISRAIENLVSIYESAPNANQVVFTNTGLGTTASRVQRNDAGQRQTDDDGNAKRASIKVFSPIRDMVERLVQRGIPREQIAIVDGSTSKEKRAAIAEAMNNNEMRIVIGSTQSLGVGVNMQRNLYAMHHLDAPYMPGDLEQRNGRGHRQGNQWNTVREFRYVTDRLDGRRWQILSIKQQFIEDFLKADGSQRVIEGDAASDEESDILSTFSEAAGDPRILVRQKLAGEIEQLRNRQRLHEQAIRDAKQSNERQRRELSDMRDTKARWERDGVIDTAQQALRDNAGDAFTMTVGSRRIDKRKDAEEAIDAVLDGTLATGETLDDIANYGGLSVSASWPRFHTEPVLHIDVAGERLTTNRPTIASLEATLRGLPDRAANREQSIADTERAIQRLDEVQEQPFARADRLAASERQLEALEKDMDDNPVPPPAWLRQGAPIDTEVRWQGDGYTVTGHRWTEDGWFVLSQDANGAEVVMPYTEVVDEQGMPLYEERTFEAPEVSSDIPREILDRHKVGARMVAYDDSGEQVAVAITRAPFRDGRGEESGIYVMARFPDDSERRVPVGEEVVAKSIARDAVSQTPGAVRDALRQGPAGRAVAKMLDQGRVQLHATVQATGRQLPGNTGAFLDRGGKVHLIAGNIAPGQELPTLMHEVFHGAARPMAGSAEWSRLESDLRRLYHQADRSQGRFKQFLDAARRRVEQAQTAGDTMTPEREIEEFGAYAVEEYERAPKTMRKWVDNAVGVMQQWLRDVTGIQLGRVTPAQLRAMALAGMRRQAAGNGGTPAPSAAAEPLSVSDLPPEQRREAKRAALDEAMQAMDEREPPKPSVGRVIGDMSRIAKFFAHPRTVASLHKPFQPVYQTGIDQFEMRDAIIDNLWQDYRAYGRLPNKRKHAVNQVLELGRLLGTTWSADELRAGVTKPATHAVPKFDEDGAPYIEHEPLHAELMADDETVTLDQDQIDAYLALREMFDGALDMFRDQTLDDYNLSEFKGLKNSAGAILDSIDDEMSASEAERRQNIARFMNEIEQAKRTGYVPFTRYGDYVIAVKERLADLDIIKANDPQGGWIVRDVPEKLERFLGEIDATYDELEGGWRLDRARKQALEKENERTVYSTKVETGARDVWAKRKAMKAEQREDREGARLDRIPSIRDAIEQTQREWVGNNPLREVKAFPTAQVSGGGTVSLSELDALAEISSIDNDTWDAVREQLADTIKGLSFRKHFFQAENVPGYSGDFERSITDYMGGMGGYLSRRHHQQQWDDAIEKIKGGRLREYAEKYRAYANSPQEEFAMMRQVGFLSYIAGNLATAFVNTTQVPVMTMPALSMVAGHTKAAYEVGRAYKDALKMYGLPSKTGLEMFDPNKAPADVRGALKEAWGKGAFVPLETFEVMAASRIRHAGQRRVRRGFENLVQGTAYVFTAAERLNRLVTFIASARLANDEQVQRKARRVLGGNYHARQTVLKDWNPESFAEYIIDETQYRMGKANRPTVMRGVGAPIMQFKSFMFQTLETWYRWSAMQGREGKMSAAASIAMMVALGGLWGFPGAEDARDLVEALWRKLTKEDIDLETELRTWIYDTTEQRWLAEATTKGVTYPTGLDMSRVGMGRIMPDGVSGVFGIPFDMFIGRPSRALTDITNENYTDAAGEFMPNFLRNVVQAGAWATDGVYDSRGRKLLDGDQLSRTAIAQKAVGFQPSVVSEVRGYEWAQYRDESRIYQLKRLYTDRISRRIAAMVQAEEAGNAERVRELEGEITELYMEVQQHNESAAPEDIIEIGQRAINNRVARQLGGVTTTWGDEGRAAARGSAAHLREVYGLDEIFEQGEE